MAKARNRLPVAFLRHRHAAARVKGKRRI